MKSIIATIASVHSSLSAEVKNLKANDGFSIAREYGAAGMHLEFRPHGYPFPIVLPVVTHGSRDAAKAWTWNGSTQKPTLKPSVKTTHPDGTVSHIWITDGMCQHLSDSTDGFAGQILPLQQL